MGKVIDSSISPADCYGRSSRTLVRTSPVRSMIRDALASVYVYANVPQCGTSHSIERNPVCRQLKTSSIHCLASTLKKSQEQEAMTDLQKYINKRKRRDTEFAEAFEEGYSNFKVGVLLRQAREKAGMTQD